MCRTYLLVWLMQNRIATLGSRAEPVAGLWCGRARGLLGDQWRAAGPATRIRDLLN